MSTREWIVTVGLFALVGCGVPATEGEAVGADVAQSDQALRSDGAACMADCRWPGNPESQCYDTYGRVGVTHSQVGLTSVTSDCRAAVVNWCHDHGWTFWDAYWAFGTTDYMRYCGN